MSGRRDAERTTIAQATALAEVARFPEMNPGPVLRVQGDEGTVLLANEAARKVFGDELVGRRWHDICPGITDAVWQQIGKAEEPHYVDARIGERDYVFAHRRDRTSSLVFIFGSDITRQKDAERMLAEVARFPEMNPGPVLRCELDSKVILANAAARQVFGNELVGLRWRDCVAGIDNAMWNRIMQGTEPIYLEARIGEREYVFAHRRDHDGSLVFVFGADVTQQKQAERALRQSERMATLGTLAAGVAHELNNPAAATHRSSEQLREAFIRLQENQERLAATAISAHGLEYIRTLVEQARQAAGGSTDLDALGRSDRESDMEEWLDQHGIANSWELSPPLVAQGLTPDALARLEQVVSADALDVAVGTVANTFPVYRLLREIGEGSARISELVGALKSYSYLGQAPLQEVALHEGLDNTLVILRHKLKRGIQVEREYCADMPRVPAYASRCLHGDSQATNVMVSIRATEPHYAAVIDWGSAGWGDPAFDFAGVPLRAVPLMLDGYRRVSPVDNDDSAEARILWRHLQLALYVLGRGPLPGWSWAERPLPMLIEVLRFFLDAPKGTWAALAPPRLR